MKSLSGCDERPLLNRPRATRIFTFLKREFALSNADLCLAELADDAEQRHASELADSSNFGMAKSFFMAGERAGFDMTTEKGLQAWTAFSNARMLAGDTERPLAIQPLRRLPVSAERKARESNTSKSVRTVERIASATVRRSTCGDARERDIFASKSGAWEDDATGLSFPRTFWNGAFDHDGQDHAADVDRELVRKPREGRHDPLTNLVERKLADLPERMKIEPVHRGIVATDAVIAALVQARYDSARRAWPDSVRIVGEEPVACPRRFSSSTGSEMDRQVTSA